MALQFGNWLLAQKGRSDWIGALAASAAADPGFPCGSVDDVRARMSGFEIETDLFEALEDAEREFRGAGPCG